MFDSVGKPSAHQINPVFFSNSTNLCSDVIALCDIDIKLLSSDSRDKLFSDTGLLLCSVLGFEWHRTNYENLLLGLMLKLVDHFMDKRPLYAQNTRDAISSYVRNMRPKIYKEIFLPLANIRGLSRINVTGRDNTLGACKFFEHHTISELHELSKLYPTDDPIDIRAGTLLDNLCVYLDDYLDDCYLEDFFNGYLVVGSDLAVTHVLEPTLMPQNTISNIRVASVPYFELMAEIYEPFIASPEAENGMSRYDRDFGIIYEFCDAAQAEILKKSPSLSLLNKETI